MNISRKFEQHMNISTLALLRTVPCSSKLQCFAVRSSVLVSCSMFQSIAACCSVLQRVAARDRLFPYAACCSMFAVRCSVLQRVVLRTTIRHDAHIMAQREDRVLPVFCFTRCVGGSEKEIGSCFPCCVPATSFCSSSPRCLLPAPSSSSFFPQYGRFCSGPQRRPF